MYENDIKKLSYLNCIIHLMDVSTILDITLVVVVKYWIWLYSMYVKGGFGIRFLIFPTRYI